MSKFQDFLVTQILREIDYKVEMRNLEVKKLTLIFSEALNFNFGELQFLSAEIYQKPKFRAFETGTSTISRR